MSIERLSEGVTLYLADCREVLPTLGRVDAVVTDPPYGTIKTEWDVSVAPALIGTIMDCAPDGYSTFFYSNTRLAHLLAAIREHGRDAWVAVWHKSNAIGFERRFTPQWVPIVIAYRGNPPFWGRDFCHCPIQVQDFDHPTPKQIGITAWCVDRSSQPGGRVLDPFMGSGTTGVAAVRSGRSFTGVEIHPTYFDLARRRIEAELAAPRLFTEPMPRPVQLAFETQMPAVSVGQGEDTGGVGVRRLAGLP